MMLANIRLSHAFQLAVMNGATVLIILSTLPSKVDSISVITKVLKPAFAKVIPPGLEITELDDEHLSITVAAITLGKEELQETSRGPLPQLNIGEVALSVLIKSGNKWQLNAGEYAATLKDCLGVYVISDNTLQLAEKDDGSCLKTATCESIGPRQKRDCKQVLTDKFKAIRTSSLEQFVKATGRKAGFDRDSEQFDSAVFRKLKSWIQFDNIPEANGKSDVIMSWKVAKIQHVFMGTYDGRAISHHAIRLTTTANGNDGKPIELLLHMVDFWGEGIARYDPKAYKALTNVKNPIKPDKAVLPKSGDLTVGKLLECVSGENLPGVWGKCAAYAQRFLRYAAGDVSDCKKMNAEIDIVPFSDEALKNRLELTDDGNTIVLVGNLGPKLMKQLRRKPGQAA